MAFNYTFNVTETGDGLVVDVDMVPPPGANVSISEVRMLATAYVTIRENDAYIR